MTLLCVIRFIDLKMQFNIRLNDSNGYDYESVTALFIHLHPLKRVRMKVYIYLTSENEKITDPKKIVDTLADHYEIHSQQPQHD